MQNYQKTTMKTNKESEKYASYWIRRYLAEYLPCVRNLARNTITTYRDAIRQMMRHASAKLKCSYDDVLLKDLSSDFIKSFLQSVEQERNCSVKTRNLRLAAIHSLADYVSIMAPERIEWSRIVHTVPAKKASKTVIPYLEKSKMDLLLAAPDRKSFLGNRDYLILLFLYNTGARVEEAASLRIMDLSLPNRKNKGIPMVTIVGKGNKTRHCPLWDSTAELLKGYVEGRPEQESVFLNRYGESITRFGIYELVKKYAKSIESQCPSIKNKRLSPHTLRHPTASHLLQAGVDINTIRVWLGHVSINTTNIYAEVNLEMKMQALNSCAIRHEKICKRKPKKPSRWSDDKDLMSFLDSI